MLAVKRRTLRGTGLLPVGTGIRGGRLLRKSHLRKDLLLLGGSHQTPGASAQLVIHLQRTNGNTAQHLDFQPHVLAQTTHFPLASFTQGENQGAMALLDTLLLHIQRADELIIVIEALDDAAAQAGGELSLAFHIVTLENLAGGMHDLLGIIAIVGQNQQTLGITVQTTNREETTKTLGNQLEDQLLRMLVLRTAGVANGLVQQNIDLALGMGLNNATLKTNHVLLGIHIVRGRGHSLVIHRDTTLLNQLLTTATGGNPRSSQKLRQTLFFARGGTFFHHQITGVFTQKHLLNTSFHRLAPFLHLNVIRHGSSSLVVVYLQKIL